MPTARFNHAAAATTDESTPRLVICGGMSAADPTKMLKDVHVWDLVTGVWTEVATNAPLRSLGWLHYHQGCFYFFGSDEYDDTEADEQVYLTLTL